MLFIGDFFGAVVSKLASSSGRSACIWHRTELIRAMNNGPLAMAKGRMPWRRRVGMGMVAVDKHNMSRLAADQYDALSVMVRSKKRELTVHPVYTAVADRAAMRTFMEFHVFAVWDFMSLVKALQKVDRCELPWHPVGDPGVRAFINEVVAEGVDNGGPDDIRATLNFISKRWKRRGQIRGL